jgi:hypothetical protein
MSRDVLVAENGDREVAAPFLIRFSTIVPTAGARQRKPRMDTNGLMHRRNPAIHGNPQRH